VVVIVNDIYWSAGAAWLCIITVVSVIQQAVKQAKPSENASEDSGSDRDSDLDLSKELLPIAGYIGSSDQLVSHMFCSISTKKLKAMLPEILKVLIYWLRNIAT